MTWPVLITSTISVKIGFLIYFYLSIRMQFNVCKDKSRVLDRYLLDRIYDHLATSAWVVVIRFAFTLAHTGDGAIFDPDSLIDDIQSEPLDWVNLSTVHY